MNFIQQLMGGVYAENMSLSGVMGQALEIKRKKVETMAAEHAALCIDSFENVLKDHVFELRSLRDMERKQAERVKKLDRAFRYFLETGNPVPYYEVCEDRYGLAQFCAKMGAQLPPEDSPLRKVPEDWKPASESSES